MTAGIGKDRERAQRIRAVVSRIECFALDMDGTVYLGERWIPGARDFLKAVAASGRRYCFLTNNSSRSAASYVQKLARMGLSIDPRTQLVTSGTATAAYLQREYSKRSVFLLGNDVLKAEFEAAGICLSEDAPELVVTAFDTSLTYEKLRRVCDHVRAGLPYLATHPDYNCPTETGFMPDIGAIAAFIAASTGRTPDLVIGKPNREIVEHTLRVTGAARETTALVGDRLYTDVRAGVENGLTGILVLSGEATLADAAQSDVTPTLIVDSVAELIPYL